MLTHASLDAFERRVREGKVSGKVDADLHLIVALINVAHAARRVIDYEHQPSRHDLADLRDALAHVPE